MPINYKDPRYQKKSLAAMAHPFSNKLGVQKELSGAWAAEQGQFQQQLAGLGLQRDIFDAGMKHSKDRLKFRREQFDIGMKQAKDAQKLSIYGGLGNALIAGMFGRQKRADVERQYQMRKKLYDTLEAKYGLGLEEGLI